MSTIKWAKTQHSDNGCYTKDGRIPGYLIRLFSSDKVTWGWGITRTDEAGTPVGRPLAQRNLRESMPDAKISAVATLARISGQPQSPRSHREDCRCTNGQVDLGCLRYRMGFVA